MAEIYTQRVSSLPKELPAPSAAELKRDAGHYFASQVIRRDALISIARDALKEFGAHHARCLIDSDDNVCDCGLHSVTKALSK